MLTYEQAITLWFIRKYGKVQENIYDGKRKLRRKRIKDIIDPAHPIKLTFHFEDNPGYSEYTPGYTSCSFEVEYKVLPEFQASHYEYRIFQINHSSDSKNDFGFRINVNEIILEVLAISQEEGTDE